MLMCVPDPEICYVLTQFLFHVIAPVLEDDSDVFHMHQATSNRPSDTWLALLELSKPAIPRPPIGGHRITTYWLRELDPADCLYQFRLYANELIHLASFLDIPPVFRTRSRYAFPRVEALGLLLARFKSAGDLFDMTTKIWQ
ncbi:hypothetical protein R3P38DRAFT_3212813 [Favolaschia claudopus]|uniref:Uncharacterized protein n=1 Tax=Favolaschia claudopus TaxID=2862362 RepID=A0AAW0ADS3_9AGAR